MSSILTVLLNFALEHFYPTNKKLELYETWFDNTYINGEWHIGDKTIQDSVLSVVHRNIADTYYLIEGDNRYFFGAELINFKNTQKINLSITSNDGVYDVVSGIYKNNYIYVALDDGITSENIESIQIQSDETIEHHVFYNSVNEIITGNDLSVVTKTEYEEIIGL